MTEPTYGQPEIPPAVDPWATGELRSDPTTSTPTPWTVPQVPVQASGPPTPRGVAPVATTTPGTTGDWEPMPPYRGGSRRSVVLVAVVALAAVVGAFAFALTGARSWFAPQTSATTAGPPASGTSASVPPAAGGPFDGTPAQTYPKGTDGIELPAAVELPGFTTAQVTAGLQQVKQALQAARLDPRMLTGHDTSVLVDLLAPDARGAIQDAFDNHKFLGFATQLGPGVKLSTDPIRVKGSMTFSATTSEDASKFHLMQVQTNFVWVYGFDSPSAKPGQRIVTIHDQVTWLVTADSEVSTSSRGLYLRSWRSYSYNMDCTLVKQDLIGLGQPSTVSAAPSVDLGRLLDPASSLDVGANTC